VPLRDGVQPDVLEPFYGRDRGRAIAHMLLIEHAGPRVCGEIFQYCEHRAQPVPPVFSCPKQTSANALTPVRGMYRDLNNMAVDHVSVHCVRRLFKAGVNESNDLAAQFRDQGRYLTTRVRRMLPTFSVARGYRLGCGYRVAFRIKLGMVFSTFEKSAGDAISIFGSSRTDLNCREVTGFPHEKEASPGDRSQVSGPHRSLFDQHGLIQEDGRAHVRRQ